MVHDPERLSNSCRISFINHAKQSSKINACYDKDWFDTPLHKHPKQQIPEGENFTTIYRKLGLVYPANNELELASIIARLLRENFEMQSVETHSFYSDLMNRSNNWKTPFGKILDANGYVSLNL